MGLLDTLDLERLTPSRLWTALDAPSRQAAAAAMYSSDDGERKVEADVAIASQFRFRPQFVQRLPVRKRIGYLAKSVRPDEPLAASMLMTLHLEARRELLVTFLDALEIPHEGGVIDEDHDLEPPGPEAIGRGVESLDSAFPREQVDTYLASLVALDSATWGELSDVLRERREG